MKLALTSLPFRTAWDELGSFRLHGGRVLVVPKEFSAASTNGGSRNRAFESSIE
jgi:hypothetical protein